MKHVYKFLICVIACFSASSVSAIEVWITPSAGSTGAGTYASGSDIAITTNFSGGGYTEVEVQIAGSTHAMGDLTIVGRWHRPSTVKCIPKTVPPTSSRGRCLRPTRARLSA